MSASGVYHGYFPTTRTRTRGNPHQWCGCGCGYGYGLLTGLPKNPQYLRVSDLSHGFSIKQGQIVIIAPAELPVALPVTRKTGTGFCGFAKSVPAGNPYLYPWENPYGLHYPC
ncbi:hypothetical protein BD779DRAFT_1478829 [Infundibulicybe gibba]|nr:hypothetical protein BD779DRAFT_1478829 [Infundibulicybe gibba]